MVQTQSGDEAGLSAPEAALFAHDLKNLLATVLGHAELQYRRLDDVGGADTELGASLRAIQLTGGRAVEICEDLLAIARGARDAWEPVDLAGVAAAAASIFEARAEPGERCRLEGARGAEVAGSRLSLERAALNLLWNGWEAACTAGVERPALALRWGAGRSGSWLEVQDNGPGLPGGSLAGLAEPYRSTKSPGAGPARGLGLHAVAGILRVHGGRLTGRNAPAGGAVLRMEFGIERELDFGASADGRR